MRARLVLVIVCLFTGRAFAQHGGQGGNPGVKRTGPEPQFREDNVLILVADDLGTEMIGAYGQGVDPAPTPNIDRLAAEGVLFRNAWSQATCSPTRATIQTGRYGFRTGIGRVIETYSNEAALSPAEITLPEMLDRGTSGRYAHAAFGKWHLGSIPLGGNLAPNVAGYRHYAGSLEGQIPDYFDWIKVVDGRASRVTRYATSETVDDALQWIEAQTGPWMCYVAFQAPHAPYHHPPGYLHTQVLPPEGPRPTCSSPGSDPRPFYKAMVEALDTEIGRLLDGLPPAMAEHTTVIFLSDNGSESCVRAPSSQGKGTLYRGGINIPFIVWGSRVRQAGECLGLVNTTDVFATVADLADVDPGTLGDLAQDSVSLLPYLLDPERPSVRRWIYAETFSPNGAGNPVPLPPCPVEDVCQQELGFDGPGDASLSICGLPLYGLYGANTVPVTVSGGPAGAAVLLRIGSFTPAYDATLGAWTVSNPPEATLSYVLDPQGRLATNVWTGAISQERYYQAVVADPAQPQGFSVSNAVRIEPLWTDMQAARTPRYKLIRFHPCGEEFYDLFADPDEQTDLLSTRPLSTSEFAAYKELALGLDIIR